MRVLIISIVSITLAFGIRPAIAQDEATKTALQAANNDVQTSQAHLHQERRNYLRAVQTSGRDSPQALAAKGRVDTARGAWREKMSRRQTLRHQARREMAQRRTPPK